MDGTRSDFGIFAAHDARQRNRRLGVGNNQRLRIQAVEAAVKSGEGFIFRGAANDDVAAGELIEIKGVQGLTGFHEHEVRHIHNVVDAAQADGFQGLPQPVRRGPHFHVANDTGGVIRT